MADIGQADLKAGPVELRVDADPVEIGDVAIVDIGKAGLKAGPGRDRI